MGKQASEYDQMDCPVGSLDDEAELVERSKSRPEEFGKLYDRYYTAILNYIYHRTFDVALAEELTSNTFFHALRALGRYKNCGKFAAWLYHIAGNEIRLNLRARRNKFKVQERWRSELSRMQFVSRHPAVLENAEEQAREYSRIHEALCHLPEKYQTVLVLRYFEALSYDEIADVLGTKLGTIKSLIHRGLARLRKQYERNGATISPTLNYIVRKE